MKGVPVILIDFLKQHSISEKVGIEIPEEERESEIKLERGVLKFLELLTKV